MVQKWKMGHTLASIRSNPGSNALVVRRVDIGNTRTRTHKHFKSLKRCLTEQIQALESLKIQYILNLHDWYDWYIPVNINHCLTTPEQSGAATSTTPTQPCLHNLGNCAAM